MKKILIIIIILILIGVGVVFYFNETRPDKAGLPDKSASRNLTGPTESENFDEKTTKVVLSDVPFILQAPFANWDNPIFQDACEEAAILMVKYWLQGKEITKQEAYDEIIALADFEEKNYGNFYDHSAGDTAQIMKDYIGYQNIEARHNIDIEDIKSEIRKGNLVIVPINGQAIGNPYYTQPGPERHMLVIIGWDKDKGEFITNDSGTKRGKNYRYNENILFWSIRDYPTGHKVPIVEINKVMIIIKRV